MGIVISKYKGDCSKCKSQIVEGEKCFVEKGVKGRLCVKCAPPGAKETKPFVPKPVEPVFRVYAQVVLQALIERRPNLLVPEVLKITTLIADGMVAEELKRGIK
jgi:hypothetical protein